MSEETLLGKEKIEWRGVDSKVFEKLGKEGEYQLIGFDHPVHYLDTDGKLKDIDCTVVDGRVEKAPYTAELMTDKIGLSITYRDTGQRVDMILHDYPYKKPHKEEGNIVEFSDVAKDIDIVFEFNVDHVKIWRVLRTAFASKNAHFESIIDKGEGDAGILPKFFGTDAKKREAILETTFDDPIEHITVSGKKVLRQHIYDKFTDNVVRIDEKTRVRTPSDDVEYPVMIDPVITSKADDRFDSGTWDVIGSTTFPTSGTARAFPQIHELIKNQSGIGTSKVMVPGDNIGVFYDTPLPLNIAGINFQVSNQSATGTVTVKLYDAITEVLLLSGQSLAASSLNTFNGWDFFPPSAPIPNAGGGYYIVIEFDAGGTGTVTVFPSTVSPVTPSTGQQVRRVSGVWTKFPADSAPRINLRLRQGAIINEAGWTSMTQNGLIPYSGTDGRRQTSYHTFKGITIPMGATINTALMTLQVKGLNQSTYSPFEMTVKAANDKSFSLPDPSNSRTDYASIQSELSYRTGTGAVPFVKNLAGTQTLFVQDTLASDGTDFFGRPTTKVYDVKPIVQRLVDQFDYSNDSMFFQLAGKLNQGRSGSYQQFLAKIYTKGDDSTRPLLGLGKNPNLAQLTTATSLGTSIFVPKLVIDFSAGATPVRNFSTDAMLLVQGSVFGRCKNGGP